MPCFHPIQGYQSLTPNLKGKHPVFFKPSANTPIAIKVPCGQCKGCRINRSQEWAIRCVHEASLHPTNVFITNTYNDQHNPYTLVKKDFQDFMKRLNYHFPEYKQRYYMCGEYGETTQRPHYHAILFGLDFPDKKLHQYKRGNPYYTSEKLQKIWQNKGYCVIGEVTYQSIAYTARYIMKKITGEQAALTDHYVCKQTGVVQQPEYNDMSRRPGIAKTWFEKYKSDIFPSDEVVLRTSPDKPLKFYQPPKYYGSLYEVTDPAAFKAIKEKRIRQSKKQKNIDNNTPERLKIREQVLEHKLKKLKRELDHE